MGRAVEGPPCDGLGVVVTSGQLPPAHPHRGGAQEAIIAVSVEVSASITTYVCIWDYMYMYLLKVVQHRLLMQHYQSLHWECKHFPNKIHVLYM